MKGKIAIIGIGCAYTEGFGCAQYWKNIINNKNISPSFVETRTSSIEFDPSEFGLSKEDTLDLPAVQLYSLVVAKQAMIDGKIFRKNSKKSRKEKTGVIISASSKVAGCISKVFDLGGTSCNIDSECGSELVAVRFAVDELKSGNCDVMLCGGIDSDASDKMSEMGMGIIVLKRYADAKKDGDKIYAVIKEVNQIKDDLEGSYENGIKKLITEALSIHEKVKMTNNDNKLSAWIINDRIHTREASVVSRGFSGMSYNVVLEEDKSDYDNAYRITPIGIGVMFSATSKVKLISRIKSLLKGLEDNKGLWLKEKYRYHNIEKNIYRLAFVARDEDEVTKKCIRALELINEMDITMWTYEDITYSEKNITNEKITALFSGTKMENAEILSDVAVGYPNMRKIINMADNIMIEQNTEAISDVVYHFNTSNNEKNIEINRLTDIEKEHIVLTTFEAGLYNILSERGFDPDMMIGHSAGELVALWVDGVYDIQTLIKLAKERGLYMSKTKEGTTMATVMADKETVANYIAKVRNVYIACENSVNQTVISGDEYEINKLYDIMTFDGIDVQKMNISGAYHSPYMVEAASKFKEYLATQNIKVPSNRVMANFTGDVYNANAADTLVNQIVSPILFATCINKAYEKGARVFVEIGSGKALSELSKEILRDKDCEIISLCPNENNDVLDTLEFAMARLAVLGYDIKDDKYRAVFDERMLNKKTKDSYEVVLGKEDLSYEYDVNEQNVSVDNNYFEEDNYVFETNDYLEDESGYIDENEAVEDKVVEVAILDKEVSSMSNIKEVQLVNAEVFNKFMDVQTSQLSAASKMLEVSNAKTEEEKKHIIDLVTMFQNNSLQAYKTFFEGTSPEMIPSNVVWTETAKEINKPLVGMNGAIEMAEEK